jgi:hypothetical protein
MILRLLPEVVSKQWTALSGYIAKSLPEGERSQRTLLNILDGILGEKIHCWISYDSQKNNDVNAIVLLTTISDPFKEEKNLLVYTITRVEKMSAEVTLRMYQEGMEALHKFMRANGFSKLIGYIDENNTNLVSRIKSLGADLRWHWAINAGG